MTAKRSRAKGRKESGPFTGIPWVVLDHPDVAGLSGNAFKLLLYLARQFRGRNNGDLSASYSVLKDAGAFNSRDTIQRAKRELIDKGIIVQTREGRFTNPGGICALYALSWIPIHECGGKLDVEPTTKAPRSFKQGNPPVSRKQ